MLPGKLKSKRGVTLPVAIGVTCVLVILSISLIGIALTSISGTSGAVSNRQAYLNARSALEYAVSYYSKSENITDLQDVDNWYMVMKDKEGGTVNQGAEFVADESETDEYATYVFADYIEPEDSSSDPKLKIVAYARSRDAFGKKVSTDSLAAYMTPDSWDSDNSGSNMFPPPEIVPASRPTDYVPPMDAITLHVRQYPGQNWTPFYYLWTYNDVEDLYGVTDNCYGLETYYKSKFNVIDTSLLARGPLLYYKNNSSGTGYVKAAKDIPAAFTSNHKNVIAPSPWNAVGDVGDPRNGPATSFSAGDGGWYNATYYIDDENVNYFNLIITKKGQVLNGAHGEWHSETQTSEMFHLWYLFSNDKNVYFEFLKPGLKYQEGPGWNGLDTLSDRMLVYVKNKKTTVHFRVKGIGDTEAEANSSAPTNPPTIDSVNVNGVSIFNDSVYYSDFSNGNASALPSDIFNSSNLEQVWHLNFMEGDAGRGEEIGYFYGINRTGQNKMLYEGCGWWVANIACGEDFDMTFTYYDKSGNAITDTVNVSPNTNNEAFVVVDPSRPGSLVCHLTEQRACDEIGLDYKSYTTVRVKSSMTGTTVAPYLDYDSKATSTTAKRKLTEKIDTTRSSYLIDDYEDASFNALQDILDDALALINDPDLKSDAEYEDMIDKIDDAVKNLRTKVVDRKIYKQYEELVKKCDEAVEKQKDFVFDISTFAAFTASGGEYQKAKDLVESGDILKDTKYTSSVVIDLINALQDAYNVLVASELNKDDLIAAIKDGEKYQGNSRYKAEYLEKLDAAIETANNLRSNPCTQEQIDEATTNLRAAINDLLANPDITVDIKPLIDLITQAESRIADKSDCIDDTYDALQTAIDNARKIVSDLTATQDKVDALYNELQTAYDAYYVYKPGSGTSTGDSYSTDRLLSEGKIRMWIEGVLPGTVVRSHKEVEGGPDIEDEDAFEISGFTMQLFKGNMPAGNFNISAMNKINGQKLMYRDLDLDTFNKVRFTITAVQSELGEYDYSTGHYKINSQKTVVFTSKDIELEDLRDGNLVFSFDSFVMSKIDGSDSNVVIMNREKLSELYISGTENAVVEVTDGSGKRTDYPTIEEGPYRVARFVYDVVDSKRQNIKIRYYSIDNKEYLYSEAFDSPGSGQYVIIMDEQNKADKETIKINIPYNSTTINGDNTTFVGIETGDGKLSEAYFDGEQYVYTADYTGEFKFKIVRNYGEGGKLISETENYMNVPKSGEMNVSYTSDTAISAAYTGYTFKTVPSTQINAKSIYPRYSTTSGSGSTIQYNSVGELKGLVSTKLADNLLTIPKITAASTTLKKQTVNFDYFNQVMTAKGLQPMINMGKTVIWIEADNAYLNKKQPWVYVWDRSDRALNGAWPGMMATRVEQTDYYYVVTDASAFGLIITTDNGANKIGGTPTGQANDHSNNGGEIYLDLADRAEVRNDDPVSYPKNWKKTCYGKSKSLIHNSFAVPGSCKWGEDQQIGGCCLYTIIDAEVLSANGYSESRFDNSLSWTYSGEALVYDYHATTGNKCPDLAGHRGSLFAYAPGKVGDLLPSIGGAYKYYYRAKRQDTCPQYETLVADVSRDDMDGKELRMPFIGGSKIRLTNLSYDSSYSSYRFSGGSRKQEYLSDSAFKSESDASINSSNLFGGSGGNRESMGRVGDAKLSILYDWYERKIPVDQSNEYTFQVQGLRYTSSNGKQWFDNDYKTDTTFTQRVEDVHGNVWLVMKDITMTDGLYSNMTLSTVDPETVQLEDDQAIYVKKTTNISSVTIDARGVGTGNTYTMTDDPETTSYWYAKIPSKTPFLTITVYYTDGTQKTVKTSLQGGDLILFDPNMNAGTGGWNNYVPHKVAIERALYSAHALYYGKVLPRKYNDKGNPENLGDNGGLGSFKYAKAFESRFINRYFTDGEINSAGYSADINEVNNWVSAYTELYAKLSEARAYVPGHNYPEYLHGAGSDIYSPASIAKIEQLINEAENIYESASTTVDDVITITRKLDSAIESASVNMNDDSVRFFFVDDTGRVTKDGGEIHLKYQLTSGGIIQEQIAKFFTENGNYASFYVEPNTNEQAIYNVQFVIRYPNGDEVNCDPVQAEVSLIDKGWYSDWYFIYQPNDTEGSVSRWHKEPVADVRTIRNSVIEEGVSSEDNYIFDLKTVRATFWDPAPTASSENSAKDEDMVYQDLYMVFKDDVQVIANDPDDSYVIKAGAYRFGKADTISASDIGTGAEGPLVYTENGGSWAPRLNLFTELAKNYFTKPTNYGEYVYPDDGGDADDYVDGVEAGFTAEDHGELSIVAGAHISNKNVNMTATSGSFAANRLMKFITSGNMYFRWQNSSDLDVYNNVTMQGKELTLASTGKIVSPNADKHFWLGTYNDDDSMELVILTDLNIEYVDRYGETQKFTIRRGICKIKKEDPSSDYIADLFDKDYWSSPYVQYHGTNGPTKYEGSYTRRKFQTSYFNG